MRTAPAVEILPHLVALEDARAAYLSARWADALLHGDRTAELARIAGDRETEGRGLAIKAEGLKEFERLTESAETFETALTLLTTGIYRACAQNDYGYVLISLGRPAEAAVNFDSAYLAAMDAGAIDKAANFGWSKAFGLYADGEYRPALAKSIELESLAIGMPDVAAYHARLQLLAMLALGWRKRALAASVTYRAKAHGGSEWDRLAAQVLRVRAEALAGRHRPLHRERALLTMTDDLGVPLYSALARLWFWAAIVQIDPVKACARRGELVTPAEQSCHVVARVELATVARTRPLGGPTDLDKIYARVEATAYLAAFAQTAGRAVPMAELLGRKRSVVLSRMADLGLPKRQRGERKTSD